MKHFIATMLTVMAVATVPACTATATASAVSYDTAPPAIDCGGKTPVLVTDGSGQQVWLCPVAK